MKIKAYRVYAFVGPGCRGNGAGVCILDDWKPDSMLLNIAQHFNFSETAFFIPSQNKFELRWFSPKVEVDLCGHATLAAASIIFEVMHILSRDVVFSTISGDLKVSRYTDLYYMEFPKREGQIVETNLMLEVGLGLKPDSVLKSRDYIAIYSSEEAILEIQPDFQKLCELDGFGVVITAPGKQCDFVSRFFGPKVGINEDPVTGSSHCSLIPYWAKRLNKNTLYAQQLSKAKGELFCENLTDRVKMGGRAWIEAEETLNI